MVQIFRKCSNPRQEASFQRPGANLASHAVAGALIIGFVAFFLTRHMRYARDKRRDEERAMNTALFGVISAPNGLEGHSHGATPPPYYEALKSAQLAGSQPNQTSAPSSDRGEKSSSMLMDECWRAVYAAEDSTGSRRNSVRNSTAWSHARRQSTVLGEPASPRGVAHGEMRQSVSRWFRNQKWLPSKPKGTGPLCSNPAYTESMRDLPVPPSPSYTGVPPTPTVAGSTPATPNTATFLAPGMSPYSEPMSARSARSWLTGDDRLSIRASIPNSVLYPSPLQPAPPPRRRSGNETYQVSAVTPPREPSPPYEA